MLATLFGGADRRAYDEVPDQEFLRVLQQIAENTSPDNDTSSVEPPEGGSSGRGGSKFVDWIPPLPFIPKDPGGGDAAAADEESGAKGLVEALEDLTSSATDLNTEMNSLRLMVFGTGENFLHFNSKVLSAASGADSASYAFYLMEDAIEDASVGVQEFASGSGAKVVIPEGLDWATTSVPIPDASGLQFEPVVIEVASRHHYMGGYCFNNA